MPGPALTMDEREEIRAGLERGETFTEIAAGLGRARSSVSREVRRNGGRDRYRAAVAQRRADRCRRRPKPFKLCVDAELAKTVHDELRQGFSPAAISMRTRQRADGRRIAAETIYAALYSKTFRGLTVLPTKCLRTRRRYRRPRSRRALYDARPTPLGRNFKTIDLRPRSAADRVETGHWEGDLICGPGNKTAVVTMVERATRFTVLGHLEARHTAADVLQALTKICSSMPAAMAKTITWDRGTEMACWSDLEQATGLSIYFCDARSPWQRGTNEHTNRQLRFWLPKGKPLDAPPERLAEIAAIHNAHPRRLLGWRTPAELYAAASVH